MTFSETTSRISGSAPLLALVLLLLAGCGGGPVRDGPPRNPPDLRTIPDAVPKAEPRSRYGNPSSYVVNGRRYYTLKSARGYVERGIASWYGRKFHGRRTSSGERYDMYAMTAAHTSLPLPTYVMVTNLENGRRAIVRVNDRGPFHANRLIDLSYAAARKLGITPNGTGFVEVRAVGPGTTVQQEAPPAAVVSSDGTVRLYLQAGAFSVRANAERLRGRLEPVAGGLVNVSPIVLEGTPFYRVRIGPLPDVVQADRLTYRLISMGLETPQIVLE